MFPIKKKKTFLTSENPKKHIHSRLKLILLILSKTKLTANFFPFQLSKVTKLDLDPAKYLDPEDPDLQYYSLSLVLLSSRCEVRKDNAIQYSE